MYTFPMHLILQTDGGSRGNPGPAAYGYVLIDVEGVVVEAKGAFMGTATNNAAEYQAVIEGLASARSRGATRISIQADSELVIRQLSGIYKIKHPDMQARAAQVKSLAKGFSSVTYEHIRREQNSAADAEVNRALDDAGFVKVPFDFRTRF